MCQCQCLFSLDLKEFNDNTMNPDQTAPKEQSDQGSYVCFHGKIEFEMHLEIKKRSKRRSKSRQHFQDEKLLAG